MVTSFLTEVETLAHWSRKSEVLENMRWETAQLLGWSLAFSIASETIPCIMHAYPIPMNIHTDTSHLQKIENFEVMRKVTFFEILTIP
jgi:pseudouridine-5'-phosphate glycosidase